LLVLVAFNALASSIAWTKIQQRDHDHKTDQAHQNLQAQLKAKLPDVNV
jgi:hypothetical protein